MASKDNSAMDIGKTWLDIKHFTGKYSGTIFLVFVLGILVYSIIAVNLILSMPSDDEYRSQEQQSLTNSQFNKATIEKINALGDRQNSVAPQLPEGRINPFWE